jgi:nucleoside-diphosphate-sugar epimerase
MATLITGLGYIGSSLAERLLADGEEVVGLENFFSTPRAPVRQLVARGLRLVEGSIADAVAVERAFGTAAIETIFHLAAQASAQPSAAPASYTVETNYIGPRILLDACVAHPVRRVVFASSTRIYRMPLPRHLSERSPVGPTDLVHLSHLYGEVLLDAYRALGVNGAGARMGIVHGVSPVMKTDERFLAVPQRFCFQAARREPLRVAPGPAAVVALVHIQDAVEGLLCLRDAPPDIAVANIAGEVRGVAEIAEAVRTAARSRGIGLTIEPTGRPSRPRPYTVTSELEKIGFHADRRIEDSVGGVLDHYVDAARAQPGKGT